ncbi:MAG TPA: FecR domain-containing protein [Chitinophaga sp.]|nr:FecR domain-containing protein [Chitinophaga sp.]
MMEHPTFEILLEKYLTGSLTQEEKGLFLQLAEEPANRTILEEALKEAMLTDKYLFPVPAVQTERFIEQLTLALHEQETRARVVPFYRRWQTAAAIALLLGVGAYLYISNGSSTAPIQVVQGPRPAHDANPGQNGAILTLDDGSQVVLDSTNNGVVATQNGAKVVLNNGQLSYNKGTTRNERSYNTMTTPKGRQFKLVLPDGTKVWLNAASSLRYPTAFTGSERNVEITGEAYLEVAQMANMPFKVTVNNQLDVLVLGTSFNINAYQDEKMIRTTLLSGSVQVSAPDTKTPVVLQPGHQASLHPSGKLTVSTADEEQILAWKNGYFHFDRADIQTIMRQIARWYDVEVIYEDIPEKNFSGTIPRNVNVSKVFKILELTGNVHFSIDGNKITVRS